MAIPHIDSLLGALAKGPPLPRPHGTNWGVDHRQRHDGDGGKGFPLGGGGRPDHPLGGPPGLNRPDQANFGNARPPGIARPDQPQSGNAMPPGIDRPGLVPGTPAGGNHPNPGQVGTPGQSPVLDVVGQLPRQLPVGPGHHHHHGPQTGPVQLPAPPMAMAGSQPQPLQQAPAAPGHVQGQAGPAAPAQAPAPAAQVPLQAQVPAAPRADPVQQAMMQPAQPGQAPRAETAQALPPRAEAAPVPRGEAAAGERMAMLQRAAAAPMPLATQATTVANPAAVNQAALTAAAAGTTMATAPAATQAANQAADSRGVNPLVAADRAQVVARPDIAGTYTGEGPYRRGLRRAARALPGGLSTLLLALGAQGHAGASGRDPAAAERELREALMQWLFWLLAIIAYGCLAFAVIGLLPPGSLGGATPASGGGRAWAGGFALAGLVAGLGAWWFARGMARGTGAAEEDDDVD